MISRRSLVSQRGTSGEGSDVGYEAKLDQSGNIVNVHVPTDGVSRQASEPDDDSQAGSAITPPRDVAEAQLDPGAIDPHHRRQLDIPAGNL